METRVVRVRSHLHSALAQVPDVDDRTRNLEVAVHRVRRADHEQVGLPDHLLEGQEVGVGRDVRIGA